MKKFIIAQIILLLLAAPAAAEQINLGVRLSQGNPGHTAAAGGDPAGRAAAVSILAE